MINLQMKIVFLTKIFYNFLIICDENIVKSVNKSFIHNLILNEQFQVTFYFSVITN